ncbi:MAG TPA: hypothetical protein VGY66_16140 [Gemmataceae bacterium]|jgi:hypothetical protein|nr:hypothetical protein [Gemmataceae bacterium]
MSILIRKCLGRSRYVEELLDNWNIGENNRSLVRDLEELISDCIELGLLIQRTSNSLLDHLFEGHVEDIDAVGDKMRTCFSRATRIFDILKGHIGQAKQALEGSAEFTRVHNEVARLKLDFEEKWPTFPDTELEAEALAAYHRGDYTTSEGLLRESQCQSAKAD